jgi:hypothetical protein
VFDLRLSVDQSQLDLWARMAPHKLGFGLVQGLNRSAERVQQGLFQHIRSGFIIRTAATSRFFFGGPERPGGAAGKLTRADTRKGRLYAELEIESRRAGGKGGRLLLAGFETGEVRRPFTPGAKAVAVPLEGRPARPSIRSPVPPAFSFAGLRLTAYRGGRRVRRPGRRRSTERGYGSQGAPRPAFSLEGVQWKGRERTFLLPHTRRAPHGGVFQRIGRGRDQIRMIWAFEPPFALDERLAYVATARALAPSIFRHEMDRALEDALGHELVVGRL